MDRDQTSMSMVNPNGRKATLLLVEDDPGHAELIRRALETHRPTACVEHVADGEVALDYLFRRGDYASLSVSPRPSVILLDLRLPKIDGLDVLKEIKASEDLRVIPVVILSTSDARRDLAAAYACHANSYLVKPVAFEQFLELMQDVVAYWLGWNTPVHGDTDASRPYVRSTASIR